MSVVVSPPGKLQWVYWSSIIIISSVQKSEDDSKNKHTDTGCDMHQRGTELMIFQNKKTPEEGWNINSWNIKQQTHKKLIFKLTSYNKADRFPLGIQCIDAEISEFHIYKCTYLSVPVGLSYSDLLWEYLLMGVKGQNFLSCICCNYYKKKKWMSPNFNVHILLE